MRNLANRWSLKPLNKGAERWFFTMLLSLPNSGINDSLQSSDPVVRLFAILDKEMEKAIA